jgi:hypothetical protein
MFGGYCINDVGYFFTYIYGGTNNSINIKKPFELLHNQTNLYIEFKGMKTNDYYHGGGVDKMDRKIKLLEIAEKNGLKEQIRGKIHNFNEQDVEILHDLIESLDHLHYSGADPFFLFINIGGIDFLLYDVRIKLHNLITKEPKVMCNEYNSDAVSVGTQTVPLGFPTRCNSVPSHVLRLASNGNKICDLHSSQPKWYCTGIGGTGCGWRGADVQNSYTSGCSQNDGIYKCTTCNKCRGG